MIGGVMQNVSGGNYFRLLPGKKVIEIRPRVNWNKGLAVKRLRQSFPRDTKVLYVGDDVTDEDVFKSLKKNDYGIRIGKSRSSKAAYYLKSQKEISFFLQRLVKICH
jgi:trehalose-phosphatase